MSIINNIIVAVVKQMPKSLVWQFSKRYIAGQTLEEAVDFVKKLNSKGIYATIDVLGESIKNREEAAASKNEGLKVLDAIVEHKLMANLSIKPTQLGLSIDEDFAFQNVHELVKKACSIDNFVRIDMEDSPYTTKTINLYKKLRSGYSCVGIVLQAYLKRTFDDVVDLNKKEANYRLCKGIYVEPAEIAIKDKQGIRDNYLKVLREIFKAGKYVGVATHDSYLIEGAKALAKELNIPKDKFEFQMLLGVREDLRDKVNAEGYKIRIYVPFGKDWFAYSTRRLKENPEVTGHIIKNVFGIK